MIGNISSKTILLTGTFFTGLLLFSTTPVLSIDISTTATNIGNVIDGQLLTGTLGSGEIKSFSFTINSPFTYLDITTNFNIINNGGGFDTELGLYDSLGNLIASDDDDGFNGASLLSFGTGSGMILDETGASIT